MFFCSLKGGKGIKNCFIVGTVNCGILDPSEKLNNESNTAFK